MAFKSSKGRDLGKEVITWQSNNVGQGIDGAGDGAEVDIAVPTITWPPSSGETGKTLEISAYSGAEDYGATNVIFTYGNGLNFNNANTAIYSFNDETPGFLYVPDFPINSDVSAKIQYVNVKGESVTGPPVNFSVSFDMFAGNDLPGSTLETYDIQPEGTYGVKKAFDGDTNTFFGPPQGGGADRYMNWNFSDGFPLSAGDSFQLLGTAGGGFQPSISFANGQSTTLSSTITISSNTRISSMNTAVYGRADRYSNIKGFNVNGVLQTHKSFE